MAKRFVDTEIWDKAWYQDLSVKEKLLVKYIFEQCDCAGVWDINLRMTSFIIGETITLTDIYNINNKKELFEFIKDEQERETKVYVKDFVQFQYGKLSYNCKPHIPVIRLLQKYNIDFETIDEDNLTPKQFRKRLTASAKENIFIRDKYECQYCGAKEDLEIDHIIPISKGGTNEDDNLITACHNCNRLKSDKSLKEFVEKGLCKKLDRVSKILDTLEEKEEEQYKEKEEEKEEEITQNLYGEYQNVCLSEEQHGQLLAMCMSNELLNELLNSLSRNIEVGKERPYIADLPNAHYERLKSYYNFRRRNPQRFVERVSEAKTITHSNQDALRRAMEKWVNKQEEAL